MRRRAFEPILELIAARRCSSLITPSCIWIHKVSGLFFALLRCPVWCCHNRQGISTSAIATMLIQRGRMVPGTFRKSERPE